MMHAVISGIDPDLPRLSRTASSGTKSEDADRNGEAGLVFQNWAQTFTCKPELFFRPRDVAEVQYVIRLASKNRKHLTVVGAGHSPGDITCTEDYMMSLDHLSSLLEADPERKLVKFEAGMRLYQVHQHLEALGLGMSNLGSISEQSIGGFIATGTHGSSLKHSLLSQLIVSLTIVLSDGMIKICSVEQNHDLFKAALVSLGALGVIVDVTFRVSDAFDIKSSKHIMSFSNMLETWQRDDLWGRAEFVRVWWFPYSEKTIVWQGDRIEADLEPHKSNKSWYRSTFWAYHMQQALLALGRLRPSSGPTIERAVFRNQYGTEEGLIDESVERSYVSLNMNCLFSQYVNEWSIPLDRGVEACNRLHLWLNGHEEDAKIPFSSEGIFVHAPIELRVADTMEDDAWLSPTCSGPICYIGVIMYKPFYQAVPYRRYFQAYEYLMKELGGRPHWAKQHNMTQADLQNRYPKLQEWLRIREEVDPTGMFTTDYHKRHLLAQGEGDLGNFAGMAGRRYKARL